MMCKDLMKNAAPIVFGMTILLGYLYFMYLMCTAKFPAENKDMINSLVETLKTILVMAISFFFGTTASSKNKDEVISDIAKSTPIQLNTNSQKGE